MLTIALLWWLLLFTLTNLQLYHGTVLDRSWRPWYRRTTHPQQFWTVLTLQNLFLLLIAAIWLYIVYNP